jgi:hypothetical protein
LTRGQLFIDIYFKTENKDMENILLYFFIWSLVVMLILIFCPKDRIKLMGDFFCKVLPRIPFTGIAKILKTKGEK